MVIYVNLILHVDQAGQTKCQSLVDHWGNNSYGHLCEFYITGRPRWAENILLTSSTCHVTFAKISATIVLLFKFFRP